MSDVLPLPALVDAVPNPVRGLVENNLKRKCRDEYSSNEDKVPLDESVVDGIRESHFEGLCDAGGSNNEGFRRRRGKTFWKV